MHLVGAYEAKTHLSDLLERVGKGERITITRHGVPIAMLVPMATSRADAGSIIGEILAFRKGHKLKGLSVKKMVQEGRHY